nr:portal protein [uncultured Brevundimonas sp.]
MKTAAARFNALLTARTTVLDKARAASRLTIPGLVPESGQNEHFTPTQPYQSVGAHGVRSLSSRLFMTLFPTNIPFFRLTLDASVAEGLMTDPNFDKNAADATMAQYAQSASSILEDRLMRPVIAAGAEAPRDRGQRPSVDSHQGRTPHLPARPICA